MNPACNYKLQYITFKVHDMFIFISMARIQAL